MGSPAAAASTTFTGNPLADLDGDGIEALLEYATGSSDLVPDPGEGAPVLSLDEEGHLEISLRLNLLDSSLVIALEQTDDLISWEPLRGFERTAIIRDPLAGTARVIYRSTDPAREQGPRGFLRLRTSQPQ
jgi:hypothetical protein